MKKLIVVLLALAVSQPIIAHAGGGYVAGGVVVGGPVGPRGGYGGYYGYGSRWGYPGPRVGVYVGGPVVWGGWPWWGPPTYYSPPVTYPPVVAVQPPVVYVERADEAPVVESAASEALEPGYWYYCREKGGYYPAVRDCPGQWQKVEPVRKAPR